MKQKIEKLFIRAIRHDFIYGLFVMVMFAGALFCPLCPLAISIASAAYSLGYQPEYTVNWRTGSAGVVVSGCVVKAGYWDEARRVGDSYDWKVC